MSQEVKKLLGIVSKLEASGKQLVIDGISSELTDTKKKQLIAQLKANAAITDVAIKEWLVKSVSGSYVAGLNTTDEVLKKFGIKTGMGKIHVEVLKSLPELKPHLAAVNALMSDAYLDFGSGITGWIKGTDHILNDIIKQQIQAQISVGRLDGEGVRAIKKDILATLKSQGFEALIDRGGNQWTLERYSEMLTRTHLIRANNESNINRMKEFGVDLVEVSSHGATDQICEPIEGKIFSLSGNSDVYPQLDQEPPFHPNCAHSLQPRPDLEA